MGLCKKRPPAEKRYFSAFITRKSCGKCSRRFNDNDFTWATKRTVVVMKEIEREKINESTATERLKLVRKVQEL